MKFDATNTLLPSVRSSSQSDQRPLSFPPSIIYERAAKAIVIHQTVAPTLPRLLDPYRLVDTSFIYQSTPLYE